MGKANTRRMIEVLDVSGAEDTNKVKVELYYSKGGMNYFSGTSEPRGYWVSVTPYTDKGDGFISFMGFSGIKKFIAEAGRFGAKKMASLNITKEVYTPMVEQVLAKNNLSLVD